MRVTLGDGEFVDAVLEDGDESDYVVEQVRYKILLVNVFNYPKMRKRNQNYISCGRKKLILFLYRLKSKIPLKRTAPAYLAMIPKHPLSSPSSTVQSALRINLRPLRLKKIVRIWRW